MEAAVTSGPAEAPSVHTYDTFHSDPEGAGEAVEGVSLDVIPAPGQ